MRAAHLITGLVVAALTAATAPLSGDDAPPAPESLDRPADQTFLTYPEWFLVFSPEEYATYLVDRAPSDFPYFGHVDQFWESYGRVSDATADQPFNAGYHMMLWVIGGSTSVEYAVKATWERLVGRFTEQLRPGMTEEDHVAAAVARQYVDFIVHTPWFKFDFNHAVAQVWDAPAMGDGMVRKWERRYALTTEFLVKSLYGKLIAAGTAASYAPTQLITTVGLDDAPPILPGFPDIKRHDGDGVVVTVPRYQAFTDYAMALAGAGMAFRSIAGNDGPILLTVLAPVAWDPGQLGTGADVLFRQPVLTATETDRVAVVVPVAELAATLRACREVRVEHIFDY